VGIGASLSPADVAGGGIAFDPLAAGVTTVTLSHPTVTLLPGATRVVTVDAALSLNVTGARVGSGLQHIVSVTLDAPAPAGGVPIRLESSDPGLLLVAPNATTAATGAIDVVASAGSGGVVFYVAGVEGVTGTATLTATAPGYTTSAGTVTVAPVAVSILFLASTHTAGGAADPFQVQVGAVNASNTGFYAHQDVRHGGTPIVIEISNSDGAVAQLVTAAHGPAQTVSVIVPVGAGRSPANLASGGVEFHPLAPGQTTVVASGPGLVQLPGASLVVTVN
jgi:hypothetical protein